LKAPRADLERLVSEGTALKVEDESQPIVDSGDIGIRERPQAFNEIRTEHFLDVVDVSDGSFGKVGCAPMQTNVPREPI
jgi:hypothetical protein